MDNPSSKKANDFIAHDVRDLQTIHAKINMLDALNKKVLIHLDQTSARYCQVANLVQGKLILLAANGSIATQIRFQTAEILRKLHEDPGLRHIRTIECKVHPTHNQMPARLTDVPAKNLPALSPETGETIKAMAETISDPKLKEIMNRIASRVKKENIS